jgi:hypothetical protein
MVPPDTSRSWSLSNRLPESPSPCDAVEDRELVELPDDAVMGLPAREPLGSSCESKPIASSRFPKCNRLPQQLQKSVVLGSIPRVENIFSIGE